MRSSPEKDPRLSGEVKSLLNWATTSKEAKEIIEKVRFIPNQ
jgi:hypothetical protein